MPLGTPLHKPVLRSHGHPAAPLATMTLAGLAERADTTIENLYFLASQAGRLYAPPRFDTNRDSSGNVRLKNGKPERRRIDAPQGPLKATQRVVLDALRAFMSPLPCVFDAPGRGAVAGARRHQGRHFHFVTDLQGFYPSVSTGRVVRTLLELGAPPSVARLVAALGSLHGRLPQGAPTSGDLAGLVFRPADIDLLTFAREHQLVYTRYADDLTFSGTADFRGLSLEVPDIVRRHGFRVRQDKTAYKRGSLETLGVVVRQNGLRVPAGLMARAADPLTPTSSRDGILSYRDQVRRA